MEQDIMAVIAHFPDRGRAIERLAMANEDFRQLCVDLADAEAAVRLWASSASPLRETRLAEFEYLVRDLAAEVAATLDRNR